ncbi:MAG: hypothetical protein OEZ00_08910, partial [Dehalococcoidia bacterium]|nr:hypothetical protein [Dehalococcoidia bacterium]
FAIKSRHPRKFTVHCSCTPLQRFSSFNFILLVSPKCSTKQALSPDFGHVKICIRSFLELLKEVTDYPGKALNLKLGDSNEKGE